MDVFTGVVIETIIQKGTVAQVFLSVAFYNFPEVQFHTGAIRTPVTRLKVAEFLGFFLSVFLFQNLQPFTFTASLDLRVI